ncbi:hypothetical protein BBJ29_007657 [Phytophthora kernoviae]|uniref:phospholipase D n=1 Tax=Phytophthora kernoviae TaxID=325452 RepID=A0A421G5U9_9STRA|nr:hypothetical protein BBJ29_007657 [Phytophthora kernoviae]
MRYPLPRTLSRASVLTPGCNNLLQTQAQRCVTTITTGNAYPSKEKDRPLPLKGIRVVECGHLIAGPFAGTILSYFGADVIKVESPTGDQVRDYRELDSTKTSLWWYSLGRNKRSISIDMKKDEGRTLIKELITQSDVFIENFKPGRMEKWGLGPDHFEKTNPELVYTRVSGFGQDGPYSSRPGFASVCEAMGGFRYVNGFPDRPPARPNLSVGDTIAGIHAALGIVIALLGRERATAAGLTGKGQVVDVAIYESMFNLMEAVVPEYDYSGSIRECSGSTITGIVPSNTYVTKDGKYVVLAANTDGLFVKLMNAISQEDMATDSKYRTNGDRVVHQEVIDAALVAWTATQTLETVVETMESATVPVGLVYSVEDMTKDPHYLHRELFEEVTIPDGDSTRTLKLPAILPKLKSTPGVTQFAGRKLGEDTRQVLKDILERSPQEIERLLKDKVVFEPIVQLLTYDLVDRLSDQLFTSERRASIRGDFTHVRLKANTVASFQRLHGMPGDNDIREETAPGSSNSSGHGTAASLKHLPSVTTSGLGSVASIASYRSSDVDGGEVDIGAFEEECADSDILSDPNDGEMTIMNDDDADLSEEEEEVMEHSIDFSVNRATVTRSGVIPCCVFVGRVRWGTSDWEIYFGQKQLLRLQLNLHLYCILHRHRFLRGVHLPWTIWREKRAEKRVLDVYVVQDYIRALLKDRDLRNSEPLLAFLEVSPSRAMLRFGPSLKEGYVHMRINGPFQLPLYTCFNRTIEALYRHLYRAWMRIAFVSAIVGFIFPVCVVIVTSLPTFFSPQKELVNSDSGTKEVSTKLNTAGVFLGLAVLAGMIFFAVFVYKFFQHRLGVIRRWVVLKPSCFAAYRNRIDREPSEVFLFDKTFTAKKGSYRQGVSWMPSGLVVGSKAGDIEIDTGHYYSRLTAFVALMLVCYGIMRLSNSLYDFEDLTFEMDQGVPITNATGYENWSHNTSDIQYCGYYFTIPDGVTVYVESDESNAVVSQLQVPSANSMTANLGYFWQSDSMGNSLNVITSAVGSGTIISVVKPIDANRDRFYDSGMNYTVPNVGNLTLEGVDTDIDVQSFNDVDSLCAISVRIAPVTWRSQVLNSVTKLEAETATRMGTGNLAPPGSTRVDSSTQSEDSFEAPAPPPSAVSWHVDAEDTYEAMYHAILKAKYEILIAGWWVCPDLFLLRPNRKLPPRDADDDPDDQQVNKTMLRQLLMKKAEAGVKIYVLIYREVKLALTLNSAYTKRSLMLHPNIRVLRDPIFQIQSLGFWSHHEKIVCIDQSLAFVGGLDLCFGRYDHHGHPISDPSDDPVWSGKDYSNPIIKDFVRVNKPFEDLIDRSSQPRMPWHDFPSSDLDGMRDGSTRTTIPLIREGSMSMEPFQVVQSLNPMYPCTATGPQWPPTTLLPLNPLNPTRPPMASTPTGSALVDGEVLRAQRGESILQVFHPNANICNIQVCRSVSMWSAGVPTESSIQTAYMDVIANSKHFLYIENQFFISGMDGNGIVRNRILQALVDRIERAVQRDEVFRVYVVMPLLPAFEGNIRSQELTNLHAVMHWQFATICRGRYSLFEALKGVTNNPEQYVAFFGLRKYGIMPNGCVATEQIYIHSKLMIADDRCAIIGSANINDRSMNGDRDSEIALVIEDMQFEDGVTDEKPYRRGVAASKLRMQLFREHLGLSDDDLSIVDPTSERTWQYVKSTAAGNTKIFETVFDCAPSSRMRAFASFQSIDVTQIYENQRLNVLKVPGRSHVWDTQNLKDGDYAPWTDVNGVPIAADRVDLRDFEVDNYKDKKKKHLFSMDHDGWCYAHFGRRSRFNAEYFDADDDIQLHGDDPVLEEGRGSYHATRDGLLADEDEDEPGAENPADCQISHVQTAATVRKEDETRARGQLSEIRGHLVEFPSVFTMFVFEAVANGALALLDVATKDQLPFDEFLVVAGRVQTSQQLTCLGGRVKRDGKRRLLVLPLPSQQPTSASDFTAQTPSVQVLDVGEMAVKFLQDVRACFPTLVRKNPMEDDDEDDSDSEEEAEHKKQKRDHSAISAVDSEAAKLQTQAAEYMSQTHVKVLESLEQLFSAFQIEDPTNVQAALSCDPSLATPCQILCLDCPALGTADTSVSATTAHAFNTPTAPPEPLNVGVIYSELTTSKEKEQYLHIPVPRSLPLPVSNTVNGEDGVKESFQNATVLSFGTKREATSHGGGKNCEEMIKNIRMRHASGTFCTLVLPEKTWEQVVDEHKAFFPQVSELHGELRLRRLMGSGPCVPVELHLED